MFYYFLGSDADDGRRLDVREAMDRKTMNQNDRVPGNESLLTSWARKGPIQVYIAKYNYDPFTLSPNENPEMELPLTAGDYVLVVGDMDEVRPHT
ncbi:RIMS-binding protein 2 [Elysia marginata]|uniref:RIMS-binding protein 2 n=1 Tax=Elysia marginata TaxID=1093978 RepID=A0AAV4GKZ5_9GAST|nr:RIMS-binding protein 2 [Elysia marginata]